MTSLRKIVTCWKLSEITIHYTQLYYFILCRFCSCYRLCVAVCSLGHIQFWHACRVEWGNLSRRVKWPTSIFFNLFSTWNIGWHNFKDVHLHVGLWHWNNFKAVKGTKFLEFKYLNSLLLILRSTKNAFSPAPRTQCSWKFLMW